ncbi:MAG: MFS transporter [Bacteroidales bacterium]|nr:MFS transporter [Bacteroidales bacterium]
MENRFKKDLQYYKFCAYGFLKNLRFFEAFLILFYLEKGLNYTQIGSLYALNEIIRNIFEIPAGILSDALGRRKTMVFSFILYIISFVIFFFSETYFWFVPAILFYAFGDAFRTGTHKAMILTYLKQKGWDKQKIHYYGHTRSWSQKGSAVSALLAGLIMFNMGSYKMIFLISAIPYVLDLFLMLSYPKFLDGEIRALNRTEFKKVFVKVIREFLFSFKNKKILAAVSNTSLFSGYFKATKDYLQPLINTLAIGMPVFLWMEEQQKTAILIGVIYFFIYLMTSAVSHRSGKFADRFPSLHITLSITMVIGFGVGLLSGIAYYYGITLFAVLLFLGIFLVENLRRPIAVGYISELLNKDILATALSAESQLQSLIATVVALAIGVLADVLGVGMAITIVSATLIPFGLIFLYTARKNGSNF